MFERFTNRARRVIVVAQDSARDLQHNYIGTEHLLLGLLSEPEGMGGRALERFGISLSGTREEIIARAGRGGSPVSGRIPFTPRAKKVLELSLREALELQHNYIGTEHLLLGIIKEGEGLGAKIICDHADDLAAVRTAVLDLLPAVQFMSGRRWLRRRPGAVTLSPQSADAGEPEDLDTTPAADSSLAQATRLAGSSPIGSHHLLLAALTDSNTAAARALAALGVDLDQAREALRNADVTGTSDELPEDRGRRHMQIRVTDDRLIIEATDEQIVSPARTALAALAAAASAQPGWPTTPDQPATPDQPGKTSGASETGPADETNAAGEPSTAQQPDVIRGDLAVASSLSNVWLALRESLEDIRRRATAAAKTSETAEPSGEAAPAADQAGPAPDSGEETGTTAA